MSLAQYTVQSQGWGPLWEQLNRDTAHPRHCQSPQASGEASVAKPAYLAHGAFAT